MTTYPYKFAPIYKEKIWGGDNLARLFGRHLPADKIGESWELADLAEGVSVVSNGPAAGTDLTDLTAGLGDALLGGASPTDGRFPLLLKLLDATDILSMQVHPDAAAAKRIPGAALKTECWYVLESRDGFIYKGLRPGVTPEQFRHAIETDTVETVVRRIDVAAGDFHYLPAGTVHALGSGVVVAEVQTPSDTTYRVSDWGRGREIHVERSMECIHFEPASDVAPGASGDRLLHTPYFDVRKLGGRGADVPVALTPGRCTALMFVGGAGQVAHAGDVEPVVPAAAGDTVLLPADLKQPAVTADDGVTFLVIELPGP